MLLRVHHVQITIPRGAEDVARAFYVGVLGLREVDKPASLRARGGLWLSTVDGAVQVHVGVEDGVDRAASKAHVAYAVRDLAAWRTRLEAQGAVLIDGERSPGMGRGELRAPGGNRLELLELHDPQAPIAPT
ncbi:MAG: VOC family protein [Polyangiales bacterium]